ncbi:MAG: type I methionyl aminopeptidase [Rhodoluna sp.]|nr:type I methionyl aminopeptidase [Rhodoluna sp.]
MSREEYTAKTNAQILLMREAGLITEAALKAVRAAIKPGVSTLELDTIADETMRKLGAHSNFQLVEGYVHTICSSINDEIVHGIPRADRVLAAGDIISIDCGAEINEWNGDSAFTVVVAGGEDDELVAARQQLSDVTEGSLWVGIAALAKAEHLNEVGTAIEAFIHEKGEEHGRDYGILEDYIGHGIGRHMHEEPPVFNYKTRHKGPKVLPGLVVAIEPMVTGGSDKVKVLKDGWTVSSKDGSDAAHWEHTVAVHEGGIWVLTATDGGKAGLAPFAIVPTPIV